jgi:hypothetical protein
MSSKHILFCDEFPFEYSFDDMITPMVLEYSKLFEKLDLSAIQRYSDVLDRTVIIVIL